jgi:N-methylhydantoinase B/oxoprolinase/acetone carboxylase alpha subunit
MPAHASSNSGYMRPIHVTAPAGTVLNAVLPAASGGRAVTGYRFMDVVFGALAKAVPERVMACGDGAPIVISFDGYDSAEKRFVVVDLLRGSWGARSNADGLDGTTLACSTGSSIPVEIMELESPVRVEFCGYLTDTGGAGTYRGGAAVMRDFRLLAESAVFQFRSERRKYLPWGLQGGAPGSPSTIVLDPYTKPRLLNEKGEFRLERDQVVRTCQSGGGGYGNPMLRDPNAVWADVRDGFVSIEAASDVYGVAIDRATGALDELGTRDLRADPRMRGGAARTELREISATQADVDRIVALGHAASAFAHSPPLPGGRLKKAAG